jgi:hypothetical protein
MITLNDTATIRAIFDGCQIRAVSRQRGIQNVAGEAGVYRELIITPPEASPA